METALARLSPLEERVWHALCAGMTLREVGAVVNLPFQRISEIKARIITRLAEVLRE